jgi:SAM-dependent methyltransferase
VTIFSADWPVGPDNQYYFQRLNEVPVALTVAGAHGPVLDVGAGGMRNALRLAALGVEVVALDPATAGFFEARMYAGGDPPGVRCVRGRAESLPFRSQTFDRVLCDSALDYFDDPGRGVREMARVVTPTGRVLIGGVNYAGIGVRVSRLMYRVARRVGWVPPGQRLFWDSPVGQAQSFECTHSILLRLCGQYLELEGVHGLSIGWGVPGWGNWLGRRTPASADAIVRRLDAMAGRFPRVADYVLTIWRPRHWD